MLRNYMKIAFRNLLRNKGYSLINIAGLAIGMACCILILLWVQDELSYDGFHENTENIHRVICSGTWAGVTEKFVVTPAPVGPALKEHFAGIIRFTRYEFFSNLLFETDDKKIVEDHISPADPDFFQMFSFPFLYGDPKTALNDRHSVVLTKNTAQKYFGDENPVGKTMTLGGKHLLTVTGVVETIPRNTDFYFHIIIPFELLEDMGTEIDDWERFSYHTYVELTNGSQSVTDDALTAFYRTKVDGGEEIEFHLQPLKEIHLYSNYIGERDKIGDIRYVYLFSLIASVILVIACINFMNLTTAKSAKRAKEIGMRKVVGAHRWNIINQFLGESVVMAMMAVILAVVIVEFALPEFNHLASKDLSLDFSKNLSLLLGLLGIALFTGIVSGSYPALFLSSFKPVIVLKGTIVSAAKSRHILRKVLIVSQFSLSIILIICTLVAHQQINFMKNKKLGFNQEHLLCIDLKGDSRDNYQSLKTELLQYSNVVSVTTASNRPFHGSSAIVWEGENNDREVQLFFISADHDYLKTFGLGLEDGRFFSPEFPSDSGNYVLNQAAVKAMGFDQPLGQQIEIFEGTGKGTVIGVVKDFHFQTLNNEIEPLALFIYKDIYRHLFVKIKPDDIPATLAFMEKTWNKFETHYPFEYEFLDEDFDSLYRSEMRISTIFNYATILAIFISCLGLLGLAAFVSEQRTKEIGIRKVLGASVAGIVQLLSREFAVLVAISNVIAWPIAYYATTLWLQEFAYRTTVGWALFAASGALALIIALMTISFQAVKSALANPVNSLRYE
jgi:putative ABC transport system permease protein